MLKLIYESPGADELDAPDNVVVVPPTGDVFLQEDGGGEQFVRGVTRRGEIYDFAKTVLNQHRVLRRRFSPDGRTTAFAWEQNCRSNIFISAKLLLMCLAVNCRNVQAI